MGKTEHCRSESTDFEISDSIQRSGKLSPLAKSINVPSFRVGNALGLFTPYLNDVFLAAQILRGKQNVFLRYFLLFLMHSILLYFSQFGNGDFIWYLLARWIYSQSCWSATNSRHRRVPPICFFFFLYSRKLNQETIIISYRNPFYQAECGH